MTRTAIPFLLGAGTALGLSLLLLAPATESERSTVTSTVQTGFGNQTSLAAKAGRGWKRENADLPNAKIDAENLSRSLLDQGSAALADGDMKRGFDAYRRAVEYFPSAESHGALGGLYLKSAASSDAEFHLRRAADLDSDNPDRWLALANVYFLKQDPVAAWNAVRHAQTLDPDLEIERDANNFVVRANAG